MIYTRTIEEINNGKVNQRFRFKTTSGPKMYESGSFKNGEYKFKAYDGNERAWFHTEEEAQAWFKEKADNTPIRLDIVNTINKSELNDGAKMYFHRIISSMSDLNVERRKAALVMEMGRIIEAPLLANTPWIDAEVREAWKQGYTGEGVSVAIHDKFPQEGSANNQYRIEDMQGTHGEHVANLLEGSDDWNTIGTAKDVNVVEKSWQPYADYKKPNESRKRYRINGKIVYKPFFYGGRGIDWKDIDIIASAAHTRGDIVGVNINKHAAVDSEDGTVLVHAAGNGGLSNYWGGHTMYTHTTSQKGYYARAIVETNTAMYNSLYNNSLMFVGVLKPGGQNAGAWAGEYANRYIVDDAPAVYGSTTSWATPVVAAKVAMIKQKFPHLSAEDLVALVFDTADDMGSPHIYGHGKINLLKALSATV